MQLLKIHEKLLSNHHLFSPLSEEELKKLLQSARVISLKKGDFLFQQEQEAKNFYFVISGCVKLFRNLPGGIEKIIEMVSKNQTFAEALMFNSQQLFPVSAQAVESTELFSFCNSDYLALLKLNPDLYMSLLGDLSCRLHNRINEIEVLSLNNSTHRVIRYFMDQIAGSDAVCPTFELPVAKQLIAGHLAIQPETFSRIVHRLKEEKVITMEGRKVTILNREALASYK